jgi:hypothetical protein
MEKPPRTGNGRVENLVRAAGGDEDGLVGVLLEVPRLDALLGA